MVALKNDYHNLNKNNSDLSRDIDNLNIINNKLGDDVLDLKKKIIIIESNEQFHSVTD